MCQEVTWGSVRPQGGEVGTGEGSSEDCSREPVPSLTYKVLATQSRAKDSANTVTAWGLEESCQSLSYTKAPTCP